VQLEQKICSTALLSIQGSANYQKLRELNNKQDMKTMRATEDVKQSKRRFESPAGSNLERALPFYRERASRHRQSHIGCTSRKDEGALRICFG